MGTVRVVVDVVQDDEPQSVVLEECNGVSVDYRTTILMGGTFRTRQVLCSCTGQAWPEQSCVEVDAWAGTAASPWSAARPTERRRSVSVITRAGAPSTSARSPRITVDEVLAVGDLNFAIKCYRKITDFRNSGGSIVLVSHSPYAIRSNCDRVIWIEHGSVQQVGSVRDVCDAYDLAVAHQDAPAAGQEFSDGTVRLSEIDHPAAIDSGEPFAVDLELDATRLLDRPIVAITFSTVAGQPVVANTSLTDGVKLEIREGLNRVSLKYDSLPLTRGVYSISVVVAEGSINYQVLALLNLRKFEVRLRAGDLGAGLVHMRPTWESATPESMVRYRSELLG